METLTLVTVVVAHAPNRQDGFAQEEQLPHQMSAPKSVEMERGSIRTPPTATTVILLLVMDAMVADK